MQRALGCGIGNFHFWGNELVPESNLEPQHNARESIVNKLNLKFETLANFLLHNASFYASHSWTFPLMCFPSSQPPWQALQIFGCSIMYLSNMKLSMFADDFLVLFPCLPFSYLVIHTDIPHPSCEIMSSHSSSVIINCILRRIINHQIESPFT